MLTSEPLMVLAGGRVYSGTYCVANDFVSVALGALRLTTKRGGEDPKRIAEMLLRQLARRARRARS